MSKPIDMADLREKVVAARTTGRVVIVTPDWLDQVERQLLAGAAAAAELASRGNEART